MSEHQKKALDWWKGLSYEYKKRAIQKCVIITKLRLTRIGKIESMYNYMQVFKI